MNTHRKEQLKLAGVPPKKMKIRIPKPVKDFFDFVYIGVLLLSIYFYVKLTGINPKTGRPIR